MRKYIRALRLPFITASILPFIAGSCLDRSSFIFNKFLLGVISVIFTHLGANLLNDYADSKSGVDWQDKKWYVFFGGSEGTAVFIRLRFWLLKKLNSLGSRQVRKSRG